jgi:hypothetical protein
MKLNELNDEFLLRIFSFLLMPKQLVELKKVCKHWNDLVVKLQCETPYLSLEKALQGVNKKVVMAIAPVNCSGDVYHMLAFVILSLHYRTQIPPIFLTYDKPPSKSIIQKQTELTTGDQVRRAINMTFWLGYKNCFVQRDIPYNSAQPVARQTSLENMFNQLQVTDYIDHRLSTSIVADHFIRYGFEQTTNILRSGFRNRNTNQELHQDYQFVDQYIRTQIDPVIKRISGNQQSTIIIHQRISDKSNSAQTLSSIVPRIVAELKLRQFNIIAIYTDGRSKGHKNLPNVDISFCPFQDTRDYAQTFILKDKQYKYILSYSHNIYLSWHNRKVGWFIACFNFKKSVILNGFIENLIREDEYKWLNYVLDILSKTPINVAEITEIVRSNIGFKRDLGKLAHLELLLRLYDLRESINLKGVIGNTSGTLDLATFIGHRVFNIHHFDNPSRGITYQDYRLLLQMSFLTVERSDNIIDILLNNLLIWLNNPKQCRQPLYLASSTIPSPLSEKGFYFLSSVKKMPMNNVSEYWQRQSFFAELRKHTNQKCKEANFLQTDFQPLGLL